MKRETSLLARVLLYSVLLVFTFMTLYPVLWLIMSSFKTTQEFQVNRLGLPRRWTLQNYPLAWKIGGFGHLFINSIIYTVGITAVVLLSYRRVSRLPRSGQEPLRSFTAVS